MIDFGKKLDYLGDGFPYCGKDRRKILKKCSRQKDCMGLGLNVINQAINYAIN